jgi:glycosyltransferase involved in cell wall biosynthesis
LSDRAPIVALLRSDPGSGRYGGVRLSFDTLLVLASLGHAVAFVAAGDVDEVRSTHLDGLPGYIVPFTPARQRLRRGISYQVAKRAARHGHGAAVVDALRHDFSGRNPVLLLEQFPMLAWFNTLAEAFPRSPRVLREHNDEPRYAAMVSVHERRARRAMALRELNAVTRLYHDPTFLSSFDSVVSISADDDIARYGFTAPVTVVPAFLAPPPAEPDDIDAPVFDFGMFGSLDHGPNADAVGSFLAEVWPQVLAARPARLLVAGRAPTPALRTLASSAPSVELLADPSVRASVYDRCGAMVDPSVDGTGVAVKTLEALTFGRPVIGYSAARRGLSADLRSYVVATTSPSDLAATLATPDRIPQRVPQAAILQAIGNAAASLSGVIDGATRGS